MKYTRYNPKKRKNDSIFYIVTIIMVLVLAYIIGSIISKVFISKTNISIKNSKSTDITSEVKKDQNKFMNYVVIQCGIFDDKKNADEQKTKLQSFGNTFVVDENGKSKILLGIFKDETKADSVIKNLTDNKIDCKKNNMKFGIDTLCDAEISEIFNGCLEILDKLNEKNVRAVQMDEFKKWTAALKEVDKNSKNISALNDVKKYINALPKEITKDNITDIDKFIFTTLTKISTSTGN